MSGSTSAGGDRPTDFPFPVTEVVHERGRPQRGEVPDECRIGERARERLDDGVAERLEQLRGALRGRDTVGVDGLTGFERVLREQPDAEFPGISGDFGAVGPARHRRAHGVADRGTLQHVENPRGVADGARHAQLDDEEIVDDAVVGHQRRAAARRLEPDEAATARGDADRSATVVRVPDRDHPARDRRGRSATRSAGRALRVPGVAARPVRLGFGRGDDAELGGVGAADAHETRVEITLRERVGVIGVVLRVTQELHALVVRIALDPGQEVFENQRHAAERSVGQHAGCFGAGLFETRMDHRVQFGVELLDPRDRVVDELERRRFARPDELGLGGRVEERVGHVGSLVTRALRAGVRPTAQLLRVGRRRGTTGPRGTARRRVARRSAAPTSTGRAEPTSRAGR